MRSAKSFLLASLVMFNILHGDAQWPNACNVLGQSVTLSGFSSGGTMASQLHVAHSSRFTGVAMLSSVFYRCGYQGGLKYNANCQSGKVNVSGSIATVKSYSSQQLIDLTDNLKTQKVFLWTGTQDRFIKPEVREMSRTFYKAFIPLSNISSTTTLASHEYAKGYTGNCNYSGAYESLSYLLGSTIQRPSDNIQLQPLKTFKQAEFTTKKPSLMGMGSKGLVYVPTNCMNTSFNCRLHMLLHGCAFGLQDKIEEFIRLTGIMSVAEQNNVVMLFPRAAIQLPSNPYGCWDIFAVNGDNYATKSGVQVQALRRMIAKVLGETV